MRAFATAATLVGGLGGALLAQAATAGPAAAAGQGAVGVYQVGLSLNCNKANPQSITCGSGLGGLWGWADFTDTAADPNDPGAGSGGDAQLTDCTHGGSFNGAGHEVMDIRDWYVAADPNSGVPMFYASWTETDTIAGQSTTHDVTDASTGIPAITIHRATLVQAFGQPLPPGSSLDVQVSWKPPSAPAG